MNSPSRRPSSAAFCVFAKSRAARRPRRQGGRQRNSPGAADGDLRPGYGKLTAVEVNPRLAGQAFISVEVLLRPNSSAANTGGEVSGFRLAIARVHSKPCDRTFARSRKPTSPSYAQDDWARDFGEVKRAVTRALGTGQQRVWRPPSLTVRWAAVDIPRERTGGLHRDPADDAGGVRAQWAIRRRRQRASRATSRIIEPILVVREAVWELHRDAGRIEQLVVAGGQPVERTRRIALRVAGRRAFIARHEDPAPRRQ